MVVVECKTACDRGRDSAELGFGRVAMPDSLGRGVAITNLATCHPWLRRSRWSTANSQTLPSSTVGIAVGRAHIRFGASVMMRPSWTGLARQVAVWRHRPSAA